MEAPGTLVVARFPSVIGPVCVVKGVSAKCVLPSTPCVNEAPRVREAVCVSETVCVNETPRVSVTACVSRRLCVSERVCVRETSMCEVAVCEGDDGGHAGARSRVSESECHAMVCERRNTQVCVG